MIAEKRQFWRKTAPEAPAVVPRGAKPGGHWQQLFKRVAGTVRTYWLPDGYQYHPPAGERLQEEPPPVGPVLDLDFVVTQAAMQQAAEMKRAGKTDEDD